MHNTFKTALVRTTCITVIIALTACSTVTDRISQIGKEPKLNKIDNPYSEKGYKPISLPMPPQEVLNQQPNSLWQATRKSFFKDQRANKVGDILTIMIDIKDTADLKNKTERTREGAEEQSLPSLLGFEKHLGKILPDEVDPEALASMDSSSTSTGDGKIQRGETIKMKLAAMITQVMPNGNLVIQGRQQVRVNYEMRDLQLQGVIRPEDILNNNSISYEKIAEARISYGGKGNISDLQQPRYGQQLFDAVFPF